MKKIFFLALIIFLSFAAFNFSSAQEIVWPDQFGLPDPAGGVSAVIQNFLYWLLGVVGVIALISFAISGIQYFMAAGEERKVETAKRNLTYSIYGVIVALSGLVVVQAVYYALNAFSSF